MVYHYHVSVAWDLGLSIHSIKIIAKLSCNQIKITQHMYIMDCFSMWLQVMQVKKPRMEYGQGTCLFLALSMISSVMG